MRSRLRLRPQSLHLIEAALVGVFFVSAFRFLIGMVYSRIGGASTTLSLDPANLPDLPGVVGAGVVQNEVSFLVYMLALPLLALLFGRFRWLILGAVALAAAGRVLMIAGTSVTPLTASAMAVGGGLLYLALMVRHRAQIIPYFFLFGFGIDQIFRAVGNTLDPSWSIAYLNIQTVVSLVTVGLSILALLMAGREARQPESGISPDRGLLPFWGGVGLGGLLFLELSLLSLPNAIAGRADVDYTIFAPIVSLATLLPLIPWVRKQMRSFIGLFDGSVRGWLWMLLVVLLIVFGTRFKGLPAGVALVVAQFAVSSMWWWLVRPQAEKERNIGGLWLVIGMILFLFLVAGDNFTFEYAYVRNMAPELSFLNNIIPPFLRGFRGMGLGVLLVSVVLAGLPMVQTRLRIPWTSGTAFQSFLGLLVVAGVSIGIAYAVRPPLIAGVRNPPSIRIGTYNIHGGFNEFYSFDMEAIARTIQQSGADVVLLQQAEGGRLTSFGVDQTLWLARRLGMDTRFYPTNEGLHGLAVLSKVEIVFDDGALLTSTGNQTGLQRVQIRPDTGVITVYNTWLGFLLESGDDRTLEEQEQDQQRQLNEIFAIISAHHPDGNLGRMVVGGTFNNIPSSPLGDQMRAAKFDDPFAGLPPQLGATFWRTNYPRTRLDYLWLRSLGPVGANVMDSRAS
ncbi:MAG: endonuclease/exonuclease/phosphatase family protein, partial [Anaerolineae bacterium]|nr:endonuclease/exonuclease/phosphatase family protein [Anaerolineae bacterium]